MENQNDNSKKINDGGPAFAAANDHGYQVGMTLRDWFAGQAIARLSIEQYAPLSSARDFNSIAALCYRIADQMIIEREKQNG